MIFIFLEQKEIKLLYMYSTVLVYCINNNLCNMYILYVHEYK